MDCNIVCPSCGRLHNAAIARIVNKTGGLSQLGAFLSERFTGGHILLVFDAHTLQAAGAAVEAAAQTANVTFSRFCYGGADHLVPNERTVSSMLEAVQAERPGCLIAVGSGVVNDICRYVASKRGIPYIGVMTAASMDGYASTVAPLILGGLKTTLPAVMPLALIGDPDLYGAAPPEMAGAGFGDIMGKINALADWRLARDLFGEYHCETIAASVQNTIDACIANAEHIAARKTGGLAVLMDALVQSGLAISYVGHSRPASGAEHHVAHFFEMESLFANETPALHGAAVGVATLAVLRLRRLLAEIMPDFDAAIAAAKDFSIDDYTQMLRRVFRMAADGILAAEMKSKRPFPAQTVARIEAARAKWPLVQAHLKKILIDESSLLSLLHTVRCPASPKELGISREVFTSAILHAKEIRGRYTVLQLAGDLGLLPQLAETLAHAERW